MFFSCLISLSCVQPSLEPCDNCTSAQCDTLVQHSITTCCRLFRADSETSTQFSPSRVAHNCSLALTGSQPAKEHDRAAACEPNAGVDHWHRAGTGCWLRDKSDAITIRNVLYWIPLSDVTMTALVQVYPTGIKPGVPEVNVISSHYSQFT